MIRFRAILLALCACFALVACESAAERAERHYQSALGYLDEGEVDLALVDLRRVFEFDEMHRDARALYASTIRDLGRTEDAYGQYLRLVEQYPDDLEGRVALAEMAFDLGEWTEMERHGTRAVAIAPDAPEVAPIAVALDYRAAVTVTDAAAIEAAADDARAVLEDDPDDPISRRILVHHLVSSDDPEIALIELDGLFERRPDDLELHLAKLQLLTLTEDEVAIEAQLEQTFALFPGEASVQQSLFAWYRSRGDVQAAEAHLRKIAALTPDNPDGLLGLVRFIEANRGAAAAMRELEALEKAAAGTEAQDLYRSMAAAMVFDLGERDEAIDQMHAIIGEAPASDQTRNIKVMLARMLETVGEREKARSLVAEVLAEDATHVGALKLRAATAIGEDRAGDATADLRAALDQAPGDPEILTLMAAAHEREGNLELAGERLALAVDASGGAVPESVRYSRFLLARERAESARQVLTRALRVAPGNLEVTALLAETLMAQEDWAGVEALRDELEGRTEPEALALDETLATALMLSPGRVGETAAILERQVGEGGFEGARRELAGLVLVRARTGDFAGARAAVGEALAQYPGDLQFGMMEVALDLGTGEDAAAEAKLRRLLVGAPGAAAPLNELLALLHWQARDDEALEVVEEQVRAMPGSPHLRAIQGGLLAELGRIEDAIAVLEALYAEDTSNVVVANNLANVLATHRGDDPETLERAATIARRLRGREVPAFQDTYGWIEFRRGNIPEALAHLEPAAAGLPEDALVQYHLGRVYEETGRPEEARVRYQRSLDLARGTEIEGLPQFDDADARLAALATAPAVPAE